MAAIEVLREARALIEKPENWTRGTYAADEPMPADLVGLDESDAWFEWYGDHGLDPDDKTAKCFCSSGAILRVSPTAGITDEALQLLKRAAGENVPSFNDSHSHAEVLAAFDRAIQLASS